MRGGVFGRTKPKMAAKWPKCRSKTFHKVSLSHAKKDSSVLNGKRASLGFSLSQNVNAALAILIVRRLENRPV